ncbi:MAG: hypothetical protein KIH01_04760 [Candidatus Freyarchaeota archaeon]|nr:hypothetical protein [Candidatus Jordarchaeia archaeon]
MDEAGIELSELESSLHRILSDPLVSRLLASSNLTRIQFETLIIHFLLDENAGRETQYSLKGLLRSSRNARGRRRPRLVRGVTKGAFRRVLGQACRNVLRSIYTLILLGYVGLLDSPNLAPYLELSNLVSSYRERMGLEYGEHSPYLKKLEEQLIRLVEEYAKPFMMVSGI